MVKVINIDTKTRTIRVSNADGDIKTWRTTESGTHFPIKKGESTKEALDKFVEKKRPEATPKTAGQLKKAAAKLESDPAYHYERADRLSEMIKQREKELDSPNITPTAKKAIERGIGDLQLAISKHWDAAGKLEKAQKKTQPAKKDDSEELETMVKAVEKTYGKDSPEAQRARGKLQPKKESGPESFKSAMQTTMKAFPRLYDFEKPHLEEFANKVYDDIQNNPGKEKEVLEHLADAYKHHIAGLGAWVDTPTLAKKAFLDQMLESHLNKQSEDK